MNRLSNFVHQKMNMPFANVHKYVMFPKGNGHASMNKQASLARKNLDKRLSAIREVRPITPGRGWARAIREALGMTMRQLAHRMNVAPSRIVAIEKAEETGSITIKSLREAAEALGCEFVYAFVPRQSLDDTLRKQVSRKIDNRLRWLNHSMRLENQ